MLRCLSQASIRGQRVILRADFNVPISEGRVRHLFRIRAVLPTITKLLKSGNRLILISHHSHTGQTLAPVARVLSQELGKRVLFITNPFGPEAQKKLLAQTRQTVVLIENLRFFRGERGRSTSFARKLSKLGDVLVNDAFGVSHRQDASLTLLPLFLPSFLGLNFEKELKALRRLAHHPRPTLAAIFGGAKLETKLKLLLRFSPKAGVVLVGGAIGNVLLRARGYPIKLPSKDIKLVAFARKVLGQGKSIILPRDLVILSRGRTFVSPVESAGGGIAIDLGPKTMAEFGRVVDDARLVVWNGPLGITEIPRGRRATVNLAKILAGSRAWTLVGGGDTLAVIEEEKLIDDFDHVSTGGGAMLAYLAGEKLPGLEALKKQKLIL